MAREEIHTVGDVRTVSLRENTLSGVWGRRSPPEWIPRGCDKLGIVMTVEFSLG
jgi:hypothetical protein